MIIISRSQEKFTDIDTTKTTVLLIIDYLLEDNDIVKSYNNFSHKTVV